MFPLSLINRQFYLWLQDRVLAHSSQQPWENFASECLLMYDSICAQYPLSFRILLHEAQMGINPRRTLNSSSAFCNSAFFLHLKLQKTQRQMRFYPGRDLFGFERFGDIVHSAQGECLHFIDRFIVRADNLDGHQLPKFYRERSICDDVEKISSGSIKK